MRQLLCGDDNNHRVPLLGVDEVGEEYGVPDEEVGYFCHNLFDISTWWRRWECCCPRCPSCPPQCRTSLQTREGPWGDMCGFWARIFSVISILMFLGTWQCRRTRSPPQQSRIWRRSEFACQPAEIHQRPQQRGKVFQTNILYDQWSCFLFSPCWRQLLCSIWICHE